MVQSVWRGALVVALACVGLSWSQQPASQPRRKKIKIMTVHENGKSVRCRILSAWQKPDGSRVFQLQALKTGEKITIEQEGPSVRVKGSSRKSMPTRVWHWQSPNTPPPGAPARPAHAPVKLSEREVGKPKILSESDHQLIQVSGDPVIPPGHELVEGPVPQPDKGWTRCSEAVSSTGEQPCTVCKPSAHSYPIWKQKLLPAFESSFQPCHECVEPCQQCVPANCVDCDPSHGPRTVVQPWSAPLSLPAPRMQPHNRSLADRIRSGFKSLFTSESHKSMTTPSPRPVPARIKNKKHRPKALPAPRRDGSTQELDRVDPFARRPMPTGSRPSAEAKKRLPYGTTVIRGPVQPKRKTATRVMPNKTSTQQVVAKPTPRPAKVVPKPVPPSTSELASKTKLKPKRDAKCPCPPYGGLKDRLIKRFRMRRQARSFEEMATSAARETKDLYREKRPSFSTATVQQERSLPSVFERARTNAAVRRQHWKDRREAASRPVEKSLTPSGRSIKDRLSRRQTTEKPKADTPGSNWRNMWGRRKESTAKAPGKSLVSQDEKPSMSLPPTSETEKKGVVDPLMHPERFAKDVAKKATGDQIPADFTPLLPDAGPKTPTPSVQRTVNGLPNPTPGTGALPKTAALPNPGSLPNTAAPMQPRMPTQGMPYRGGSQPPFRSHGRMPLGAGSVMAAKRGVNGQKTYVPVPVVTTPTSPPPGPPAPSLPQAPNPAAGLNAFSMPPSPQQAPTPAGAGNAFTIPTRPAQVVRDTNAFSNPQGQNAAPQQASYGPGYQQQMAGAYPPPQAMYPHPGMYPQQGMMPAPYPMPYANPYANPHARPHPQYAYGPARYGHPRPIARMNQPRGYRGPMPPNPIAMAQYQQRMQPQNYVPRNPAMDRPAMVNQPANTEQDQINRNLSLLKTSPYPAQREWAAHNLATFDLTKRPYVLQAILQAAQHDPAATVRAGCVDYLTRRGVQTSAVQTTLQVLQNDPDERVRQKVHQALARINGQGTPAITPASGVQR